MRATETVLEFVDAINTKNIDKMVAMMTPDHRFTDSLGQEIPGRRAMRDAWLAYFRMIPDYEISVQESFVDGQIVMVSGAAGGTCVPEDRPGERAQFTIRGVWRARVERDRISHWQVFADNGPLREILEGGVTEHESAS